MMREDFLFAVIVVILVGFGLAILALAFLHDLPYQNHVIDPVVEGFIKEICK